MNKAAKAAMKAHLKTEGNWTMMEAPEGGVEQLMTIDIGDERVNLVSPNTPNVVSNVLDGKEDDQTFAAAFTLGYLPYKGFGRWEGLVNPVVDGEVKTAFGAPESLCYIYYGKESQLMSTLDIKDISSKTPTVMAMHRRDGDDVTLYICVRGTSRPYDWLRNLAYKSIFSAKDANKNIEDSGVEARVIPEIVKLRGGGKDQVRLHYGMMYMGAYVYQLTKEYMAAIGDVTRVCFYGSSLGGTSSLIAGHLLHHYLEGGVSQEIDAVVDACTTFARCAEALETEEDEEKKTEEENEGLGDNDFGDYDEDEDDGIARMLPGIEPEWEKNPLYVKDVNNTMDVSTLAETTTQFYNSTMNRVTKSVASRLFETLTRQGHTLTRKNFTSGVSEKSGYFTEEVPEESGMSSAEYLSQQSGLAEFPGPETPRFLQEAPPRKRPQVLVNVFCPPNYSDGFTDVSMSRTDINASPYFHVSAVANFHDSVIHAGVVNFAGFSYPMKFDCFENGPMDEAAECDYGIVSVTAFDPKNAQDIGGGSAVGKRIVSHETFIMFGANGERHWWFSSLNKAAKNASKVLEIEAKVEKPSQLTIVNNWPPFMQLQSGGGLFAPILDRSHAQQLYNTVKVPQNAWNIKNALLLALRTGKYKGGDLCDRDFAMFRDYYVQTLLANLVRTQGTLKRPFFLEQQSRVLDELKALERDPKNREVPVILTKPPVEVAAPEGNYGANPWNTVPVRADTPEFLKFNDFDDLHAVNSANDMTYDSNRRSDLGLNKPFNVNDLLGGGPRGRGVVLDVALAGVVLAAAVFSSMA